MLNVNRLRVLHEVAARGSFSAAADALSYTQSAVSQQIAALEAEAGTTLIERRPRGLRLTASGEALVRHADGILARLAAAEVELAEIAGVRGGQLRMASFPTAGATLMPLAIAGFRASHPGVELSLAEGEPEDIVPRLHAGEFDLALVFEFTGVGALPHPGLERVELLEDQMYLALPSDHQLAVRAAVELGSLAGEAWVQTSAQSACAREVVRACHVAGFEPNVAFESDDYATVQGLVAAGVGVAMIPELALTNVRADVAIRELSPESPARRVMALTPAGARCTPAAAAMLGVLGDVARRYAARTRGALSAAAAAAAT
jgi:DNA-binding transcriptional LysR family regulator